MQRAPARKALLWSTSQPASFGPGGGVVRIFFSSAASATTRRQCAESTVSRPPPCGCASPQRIAQTLPRPSTPRSCRPVLHLGRPAYCRTGCMSRAPHHHGTPRCRTCLCPCREMPWRTPGSAAALWGPTPARSPSGPPVGFGSAWSIAFRVLPVQLQTSVLLGFDANLFAEEAQERRRALC